MKLGLTSRTATLALTCFYIDPHKHDGASSCVSPAGYVLSLPRPPVPSRGVSLSPVAADCQPSLCNPWLTTARILCPSLVVGMLWCGLGCSCVVFDQQTMPKPCIDHLLRVCSRSLRSYSAHHNKHDGQGGPPPGKISVSHYALGVIGQL